jgi:protein SCO1/2
MRQSFLSKHRGKHERFACLAALAMALLLPVPGWSESQSVATAAQLPAALREVDIIQKLDEQLPLDLAFRDSEGRDVTLGDFFGHNRPVLLAPVYYDCPMLCSLILNGVVRAARTLSLSAGKEYDILVFSIDPKETPARAAESKRSSLLRYDRAGSEGGWHFLTGSQESIRRLTDAIGFRYSYDAETGLFNHASTVVALTPEGKISRYFYGVEYAPRDLQFGLIEASQNRIGSPVDHVLLYCFNYDPVTGQYGLVVMNVLRLFGVATVLALGGFMWYSLRRERRGKRFASGEGISGA